MREENHYQSPMEVSLVDPPLNPQTLQVASEKRRAVNLVLDSVVIDLLLVALHFGMAMAKVNSLFKDPFSRMQISVLILLLYYVPQELFFGRTFAKFITCTKVVSADGTTPTMAQIVGRTLCRLIPFELFSFSASYPVGWHDKFSGTRVVMARSTPTANP
jgi:uncharacterized RDD family membrane protein YckC